VAAPPLPASAIGFAPSALSAAAAATLPGAGTAPGVAGPPPYAALIAQAVQAHLRGQHPRACALVAQCLTEIPLEDLQARRDVERLAQRLRDRRS
jgi:hypothetical protein